MYVTQENTFNGSQVKMCSPYPFAHFGLNIWQSCMLVNLNDLGAKRYFWLWKKTFRSYFLFLFPDSTFKTYKVATADLMMTIRWPLGRAHQAPGARSSWWRRSSRCPPGGCSGCPAPPSSTGSRTAQLWNGTPRLLGIKGEQWNKSLPRWKDGL